MSTPYGFRLSIVTSWDHRDLEKVGLVVPRCIKGFATPFLSASTGEILGVQMLPLSSIIPLSNALYFASVRVGAIRIGKQRLPSKLAMFVYLVVFQDENLY